MEYRAQWGQVASPRGGVIDRGRIAARSPGHNNGRSLQKPLNAHQIHSVADIAARPVRPAEAAQARLFEDILRAEIAELLNLPSDARSELGARIQEVDRLLKALRDRFPRGPMAGASSRAGRHPANVAQLDRN